MRTNRVSFCLVTVFIAAVGVGGQGDPRRAAEASADTITTSFLQGDEYRCAVRTPPSERMRFGGRRQLCVVFHRELECTVGTLRDLDWYVRIDTEDKALEYVRILTRRETSDAGLEDWLGAEVEENGTLSSADGRVPIDVLKEAGWRSAEVTRDTTGWRIERTVLLVTTPSEPMRLATVIERVARAGDYRRLEVKERWRGKLRGVSFPFSL